MAALAGNPRAARMVVRVLNSVWRTEKLPWHRIINREGKISLAKGQGYEIQKGLLEGEGVKLDKNQIIDLKKYQWQPRLRLNR